MVILRLTRLFDHQIIGQFFYHVILKSHFFCEWPLSWLYRWRHSYFPFLWRFIDDLRQSLLDPLEPLATLVFFLLFPPRGLSGCLSLFIFLDKGNGLENTLSFVHRCLDLREVVFVEFVLIWGISVGSVFEMYRFLTICSPFIEHALSVHFLEDLVNIVILEGGLEIWRLLTFLCFERVVFDLIETLFCIIKYQVLRRKIH
jgi:hypothetical protein